ncbi:MAG: GNAT family N-acetyltransferase [Rhodothermales bacterium]|nr:GNAT family N-acetyltransferase [Rhodothermales bacterium]
MSFTIQRAGTEDLDEVTPLFSGYRAFYRSTPSPDEERSFLKARLENGDSVIFIAIDDTTGIALGFTQLYPMFSSVRMRRVWILNDLYVVPGSRGKGVAAGLMQTAEDFAVSTDAAGLELATEKNNSPAQSLYEKRSWKRDDEFYHYAYTI